MPINIPPQITVPFATSGLKNPIPATSDNTSGKAGYNQGFPASNMTPRSAGGIPPFGQDFNGILFDVTTALQYIEAGGTFPYSSAFATAVGGYPLGAIVLKATKDGSWINLVANNTTNPDTGGAGWGDYSSGRLLATQVFAAAGTFPLAFNIATKKVRVRLVAGGGAGGGAAASAAGSVSAGSGGGAGGYAEGIFDIATIAGQSLVVGAAGAGALAAAGGAGGNSGIGSLLTATGGGGGITIGATSTYPFQINGAAGGSGVIGPVLKTLGGAGLAATVMGATSAISGIGGMSLFAAGGPFRVTTGSGATATNGGGGGGALVLGVTGTNYAGGNGGIGFAILEEYS